MTDRLRNYSIELFLIGLLLLAVLFFGYLGLGLLPRELDETFSSSRALGYVTDQVAFGPRVAGSEAALTTSDWLVERLTNVGWNVAILPFPVTVTDAAGATADASARNLMAVRSPASGATASDNVTWIATFYDTLAAADPADASPGASAGASGAAVLVELARSLNLTVEGQTVCFALLEAGRGPALGGGSADGAAGVTGVDYLLRSFSGDVPSIIEPCRAPRAVVLLDAVGGETVALAEGGDAALNGALHQVAPEMTSSALTTRSFAPADMGGGPLIEAGIAATAFSTGSPTPQSDTAGRVEATTLERVGRILQIWLEAGAPF